MNDEPRTAVIRDVLIVAGSMIVISLLHYYTDVRAQDLHILYRRLYYLPIIYAGFRFGVRGGVVTAIAASILYGVHAFDASAILFGQRPGFTVASAVGQYWTENALEIVLFNTVGIVTGVLATSARREVSRSQAVSQELERAYAALEQRAIELGRIRHYVEAILDSVVSGVFTLEKDGSVAMANPAARRILGAADAPVVGRPLCELFKRDGGLCSQVESVLSGASELAGGEVEAMTCQGRELSLLTHVSRLVDSDQATLGAVVTLEDETEVKALTEQLIRADRLAALGELVAGIAHEIRNPMAIIKGSLQVHAQTAASTKEMRELSKVVDQEIDRLDKVIKALLDFGRPSPPKMVPVDVAKVLAETATLTLKYAQQQGVDVIVEDVDGVPPIHADADQIKQVLVNLISNAVQAMPDGGTVRLSARAGGDRTVGIVVADTGVGIPREELGRIFDPFHTRREDGTGLGLTIVHRIVEDHHGRIRVESEPGEGTTFTVSLPVEAAADRAAG